MEQINLTPITELTVSDVNRLIIHTTRSSIRRAGACKITKVVPASESVPTLYYIQELNQDTNKVDWSIHALSSDVTRFLLLQSVVKANDEVNMDSGEAGE